MTMPRVLLADSSALARRYAGEALVQAGFIVSEAYNGMEAWEKLMAEGADLLVAEVDLAKLDGLRLLRQLRRDEAWQRLPVLLVAVAPGSHEQELARQWGVALYRQKPIPRDELVALALLLTGAAP